MDGWYFRKKQLGEQNREPIHGEFFASDAISEPGTALVREGIQNSLDASLQNGDPVLVRIFLSGESHQIEPDRHREFFDGAWDHFNSDRNGLNPISMPTAESPCKFIVFEDMNTEGLTGSLQEGFQPDPGVTNHFYHFFRAEGQSDKGVSMRGSWGVGKTVFLRSSVLSTVIGLTVRSDDGRRLLMGKSVLRSHRVGEGNFQDGYLGIRPEEPNLVMPINDEKILKRFCDVFGIQRGVDESGLSIVIPWYDSDITEAEIVKAVLKDYFYPILDGQLEVMIETPSYKACLDKEKLVEEVAKLGSEFSSELHPLIELAIWAQEVSEDGRVVLESPDGGRSWKWDKDLISEDHVEELRNNMASGGRIAVRVPVTVKKKNGEARASHFDMYIERSLEEEKGRPIFIREGIIITDVKSSRSRGIRALVVAKDGGIAEFLRDAENPSHTDWNHSRLKEKYRHGCKSDLAFVVNSVYEFVKILTAEEQQEDKKLLVDVFSIKAPPEETDPEKKRDPKPTLKPGKKPVDDQPDPPPPRLKRFQISKRDGGFSVVKGEKGSSVPASLDIRVAYDIRRHNPLKKYNSADFDLGKEPIKLDPDPRGLEIVERAGNRIVANVTDPDFEIHVVGFDRRRQLYVKVTATGVDDGNS